MAFSLLFPKGPTEGSIDISDETFHDLGLENIVAALSNRENERGIIRRYLGRLPGDPEVCEYRAQVFEDILRFPKLTGELGELLERIAFLKNFGSFFRANSDVTGLWQLMHRLDEMKDYVQCVRAINECLTNTDVQSQGLRELRDHVKTLYTDTGYLELEKDIESLRTDVRNIKSVTLGVNLNERLEATSVGIVSVNKKYFNKSDVISNFAEHLNRNDRLNEDTDWNEDYSYRPAKPKSFLGMAGAEGIGILKTGMAMPEFAPGLIRRTMGGTLPGESDESVMQYLESIIAQMVSRTSKKLTEVVSKHAKTDITEMSGLIPELMYYVRWSELLNKLEGLGLRFTRPVIAAAGGSAIPYCKAEGFYNMKLALAALAGKMQAADIVDNTITFDDAHAILILTGANRGGKTTLTQAVGQAFVMAQSGIRVPGTGFTYRPVDNIFTHFPADEDKTMDLGRLGEECIRFKKMYEDAAPESLILLNETFSTTSYEEGYYIALDAVRALRRKGIRTIYNTHMHKLGSEETLRTGEGAGVASLVMRSEGGERSYRVVEAPPTGLSHARDIAEKYGVTFEQLTGE